MSSANVTLAEGDLRGIATARELSHVTVANIDNGPVVRVCNAVKCPWAAGLLCAFKLAPTPLIAAVMQMDCGRR